MQPGLYEDLLSRALVGKLAELPDARIAALAKIDAEDAHTAIAQYLEHLLVKSLGGLRGTEAVERQRRLVDRVIDVLAEELGAEWRGAFRLADPLQRLLAIHAGNPPARPDTPLARSALLTGNRRDPTLSSQLAREIETADHVDILCSFVRWSGLRLLLDALKQLTARPAERPRLRLISTSYMGATDPAAIERLRQLPNTEIKISYDTQRTCLHAKAYLIHRDTGFGSAYIGSANISRVALSEGLEWTSKISQYELPHMWQKIAATFDSYWTDPEFEAFGEDSVARLRQAISAERRQGDFDTPTALPGFDLRPYPFQEEILDALAAERSVLNKHRHLVIAATGTGKTMVAAFDYRRWSREQASRPRLLFVAHRAEILRQALDTFRGVLRDQNFGDLLVGGNIPEQREDLFCSIQSLHQDELDQISPDRYDYVVVDEFHHAAASSYRRLLDHLRPKVLLGLTATPDRADGLDIYKWFDGQASAEIRLPDAISRRLLVPFQYFGVSDSVDLDTLQWQRGGYRMADLDDVYTGNDVRANLVLDKVHETLADPHRARGLGFCVSVAHAEFMARFFGERGLPAIALSAASPDDQRRSAKQRLIAREINFIFVVDLYNEGVDIPEVDTVLFLRPTESLTIYLQQLGRGLRLDDEKDCLTVLDFIGAQRKEFRFASRLRALSTNPTRKLETEIETGFPHLPPGCSMQFERVAQQHVLENVRRTLILRRPQVIADLKELGKHYGRTPTLDEALAYLDTTPGQLLKRGLWSRLLHDAGLVETCDAPDEAQLARGIRRLAHCDDPRQITYLLRSLDGELGAPEDEEAIRRLTMLHVGLWGAEGAEMSLEQARQRLRQNPSACDDLRALLGYRRTHAHTQLGELHPGLSGPLAVHARYTRDEILAGLGRWTMDHRPRFTEGVLHLPDTRVDAFFVTLQKTEAAYSPTTMYEDYVISDRLFHWQSQSTTSADSRTGQRYIRHRERGCTPLLFVRESKYLPEGLAAPYAYLGPAEYVSHEGSRPISIIWRLRHAIPARLLRQTGQSVAG